MKTQKGIMKAAHQQAKTAKKFNGGAYIVYLSFYLKKENYNNTLIEELSEEVENFNLTIPYNSKTARKYAKELGATWNANSKTWSLNCTKLDLKYNDLTKYITVKSSATAKEGNYNTGCICTAYEARNYGYDSIEC